MYVPQPLREQVYLLSDIRGISLGKFFFLGSTLYYNA